MDRNRWFESERYQELTRATRAMDFARQIQIVEDAVAETEGAERAFWLRLRAQQRFAQYAHPGETNRGWAELPMLVAAAPVDPDHMGQVALLALMLYGVSQRADMWANFFPLIRPGIKPASRYWNWYNNLCEIRRLECRHHASMLACSKALALLDALPPAVSNTQRGRRVFILTRRAIAAVNLGDLRLAADDVQQATAIDAEFDRAYLAPYYLAAAQAELALARGHLDAARAALHDGIARSAICPHKPLPVDRVEFDLLAARTARAEGNRASFQHFAGRALATCLEWDLRLSEAKVRAVIAGAER